MHTAKSNFAMCVGLKTAGVVGSELAEDTLVIAATGACAAAVPFSCDGGAARACGERCGLLLVDARGCLPDAHTETIIIWI